MILKVLTLTDVGVYAGEQRLQFAQPSRTEPVTLIGGLNGAGKTTLMRSLFHVLYGAHALPLMERRGSYDRYLADATRVHAERASIELTFVLQRNAEDEEISVRRTWRRRAGRFTEEVEAFRNGSYDRTLSEGWLDFIESVVPRGIARLVFFDGEKVEALADLENASTTLRSAVGSLLGLDLVDQLVIDLEVLERRRAVAAASPDDQAKIASLDDAVVEAERQLGDRERELSELQREVHEAVSALTEIEDEFRAAGGDFFERRSALTADLEEAREALRVAQMDARSLAVQELVPLLLIEEAVSDLARTAADEQRSDDLRAARHVIEERDGFFKSLLAELDAPAQLRRKLETRLTRDRARLSRQLNSEPAQLGLGGVAALLDELAAGELAALDRRRTDAIEAINDCRQRLDEVERLTAQIPTEDAIRALDQRRSDVGDSLAFVRARTDAATSARDDAQRRVARAKTERERFAKKLADARLEKLDSERLVEHAERARHTLTKLRERAAARHLHRIAELAVEALEQLLRKDRLIARIEIDASTYAPSFHDRHDRLIHPEQLSAGERQLTALALLWALARASGRPLPVLIDTPLGRLDATHRRHVVSRYLPMASQQVIVLSTDTEIDAGLLEHLAPHVGASYTLDFDSTDEATIIQPGYLDLELVA